MSVIKERSSFPVKPIGQGQSYLLLQMLLLGSFIGCLLGGAAGYILGISANLTSQETPKLATLQPTATPMLKLLKPPSEMPYPTLHIDPETANWPISTDEAGFSYRYPPEWKTSYAGGLFVLTPAPNYDPIYISIGRDGELSDNQTPEQYFDFLIKSNTGVPFSYLSINGYPALRMVWGPYLVEYHIVVSSKGYLIAQNSTSDPAHNTHYVYKAEFRNVGEGMAHLLPPYGTILQVMLNDFDKLIATYT